MYNWFLIALIAPILWSLVSHIDKYVLSRFASNKGVGALLIFSALSSAIVLPFLIYFFHDQLFNISAANFSLLMLAGFLGVAAFYLYLEGMGHEEASIVVPLFQLVPIFGYLLGYLILGESLNKNQIFSSLLIISGMIILTSEIDLENKLRLKKKLLFLIGSSSLFFALQETLFKKVAIIDSFWIAVFWQYFSLTLAGLIILVFVKKFRIGFFELLTTSKFKLLSLNIISEVLYILGNLASSFATLLAPVAIVLVISYSHPLFVFLIGVFITIFLPKIAMEKITRKHLLHKIISICIIIIGSYLLYSS